MCEWSTWFKWKCGGVCVTDGTQVKSLFMSSTANRQSLTVASRLVLPVTAGLVVLALTGCGAGGEKDDPTKVSASSGTSSTPVASPSPTTADDSAELKQAVQAYSDGFLSGNAKTYEMFSKRCQDRTNKNEFLGILMGAKSTYGSALPLETFDADISDDMARVTYTYSLAAINQAAEPWIREGGEWKQDDC